MPRPTRKPLPAASYRPWLTLVGLVLVGMNLRPALSSLAPVLDQVSQTMGLSGTGAGVLTTLPVLCLGLAAPLAPRLGRSIGVEAAILAALLALAAALLLRSYAGLAGLYAGTAAAGACIGIMGVLLPGIVKRDFAEHVGALTGLYTMALCLGAALAAGATEPLRLWFSGLWRPALAFWLLPAIAAALVWTTQLYRAAPATRRARPASARLYRDALAWQVTLYMGLQSSLAYAVFSWLPSILQDRGLSEVAAGFALSVSILFQLISAFAAPWIGARCRDQRAVIATVICLTFAGLMGCIYAPIAGIWWWAAILGLGQGGAFSMALTLLVLRARDAESTAALSGMAQGVGYTLACLGPLFVGLLHDWTGGWAAVGVFLGAIAMAALTTGVAAGRDRVVRGPSDRAPGKPEGR